MLLAAFCAAGARAAVCDETGVSRPTSIPISSTLDSTEHQIYAGNYALLVGASQYRHDPPWEPLDGVSDELKSLQSLLVSQGFHVRRICDPLTSGPGGLTEVERFVRQYGNGTNRLLVYLSGHAWADDNAKVGYFAAVDSEAPGTAAARLSGLGSQKIISLARLFAGRHLLIVVDACYSAQIFTLKSAQQPDAISVIDFEDISRPVRDFMTAGAADQRTPNPSLFTPAFILGVAGMADLNHDGIVRASELALWVRDKVANSSANNTTPRSGKIPVVPQDFDPNGGDVVFRYDASQIERIKSDLTGNGPGALAGAQLLNGIDRPVDAGSSGLSDSKYQITYYEKTGDHGLVQKSLDAARIPYLSQGSILPPAGATNGIACHRDAPAHVVVATARALIEGGVHLRVIDRINVNPMKNRYVIEALRFERVAGPRYRDITLDDLTEITNCPLDFKKFAR